MSEVFTIYVASLSATGEPPSMAGYDEAREHLRALLVTEMRRRGLWTSPPSYLGVTATGWHDPEALDELVTDAYTYIFLRRLRGLVDQLQLRDSIRGLVVRNVRNFLHDRQRRADPLGFRVFTRLRKAVERLLKLGRLFVRGLVGAGDDAEEASAENHSTASKSIASKSTASKSTASKIGNSTVLAFSRALVPVAHVRDLEGPVARWNDDLMPDLVTAEGRAVNTVVEDLANKVESLPAEGIEAFRLEHVAKALKDDARRRWHALWDSGQETAPEDGEPNAPRIPIVQPGDALVDDLDWPRFRATVLECVERALAAVHQAKRQADLWRVWLFLRSTRIDAEEPQELPNYSALGHELGLPRERVAQMLGQLKNMVRRCLECAGPGTDENASTSASCARGAEGGGEDHAK